MMFEGDFCLLYVFPNNCEQVITRLDQRYIRYGRDV